MSFFLIISCRSRLSDANLKFGGATNAFGHRSSWHSRNFPPAFGSTCSGFMHAGKEWCTSRFPPSVRCVSNSFSANSVCSLYDLWLSNARCWGSSMSLGWYAIHDSVFVSVPIAFHCPSFALSLSPLFFDPCHGFPLFSSSPFFFSAFAASFSVFPRSPVVSTRMWCSYLDLLLLWDRWVESPFPCLLVCPGFPPLFP